jgi:hypothetical protein
MTNFVLVRNTVFYLADLRRLKNRRFTQIFLNGVDTLPCALCVNTFSPLRPYAIKPL